MGFAHIALATRDVRATARFFEETLGWRSIERPGNIARPAAWLEMAPGQEVHLIQIDDFAPSPFEREYGRHLAVRFPRDGFDGLKQRLRERGAEVIVAERPTPFDRFFFRSPDGYMVEVVEESIPRPEP
jgi:catechol 2,3-dioxygenase-like lactoylglutathione lyase family enzyme